MSKYEFTNDWFEQTAKENFERILPALCKDPGLVIEIGSYEGKASIWMLEHLKPRALMMVDTWKGGAEHAGIDMEAVKKRCIQNIKNCKNGKTHIAVLEGKSVCALCSLFEPVEDGAKNPVADFIYIDGSHAAQDVLADACVGYALLRDGGIMAFDDYTWAEKQRSELNPLDNPRLAIDAFYNIYRRNLQIIPSTAPQFWVMKRE